MWVILCTVEVIVCFMALFCRGNSMYCGSDRVCYGNVLWGNVVNCGSDPCNGNVLAMGVVNGRTVEEVTVFHKTYLG